MGTEATKKPGPFRLLKDGIYSLEHAGKTLDQDSLFWKLEVVPALADAKAVLVLLTEKQARDWTKVQNAIARIVDVNGRAQEIVDKISEVRNVEVARDRIRRSIESIQTAIRVEQIRQEVKRSLPNHGELLDLAALDLDTSAVEKGLGRKRAWTLAEIEEIRQNIQVVERRIWSVIKTTCDHCGQAKGAKPVVFEREVPGGKKLHREYCSNDCNKAAFIRARDRNAAVRKADQRKQHAA